MCVCQVSVNHSDKLEWSEGVTQLHVPGMMGQRSGCFLGQRGEWERSVDKECVLQASRGVQESGCPRKNEGVKGKRA
jgi:hypothetical protein